MTIKLILEFAVIIGALLMGARAGGVGFGSGRRQIGFIASMELNPQKARILLMLGLMKTSDPKNFSSNFMEY